MFQYKYPVFEKKTLLRVEMLEQLRDYPKGYLRLVYQNFSNGIVNGCNITWKDRKLMISPGIISLFN